jgi:hypothetical protein
MEAPPKMVLAAVFQIGVKKTTNLTWEHPVKTMHKSWNNTRAVRLRSKNQYFMQFNNSMCL